ncbi:hypothetical protein Bpfe_012916, partial [Biomphalaria pfeifferi]
MSMMFQLVHISVLLAALTFAMPVELIGSRVADMVVNSCLSSSSSINTSSSLSSAMQAAIKGSANRVNESVLLDQWTTILNQIEVANKLVLWLASTPTEKKKVDSAILINVIDRTNLTSTV